MYSRKVIPSIKKLCIKLYACMHRMSTVMKITLVKITELEVASDLDSSLLI